LQALPEIGRIGGFSGHEEKTMRLMVSELINYRHLLFTLAWRDIKVRYKQSVMGFLWAILMPMLIIIAGVVIRVAFSMGSGRGFDHTALASVALKSAPWAFFISGIRFATSSLTGNSSLITKIYFPREIFPVSAVLASLFDFAVALGAVVIILAGIQVGVSVYVLWAPVILFLLFLLAVSIGMLLSCANLFFRDVKYLVDVFLTFGILFTPVFYDARMFGKWAPVLLLNPVGAILEELNTVVVLHRPPDPLWLAYAACWAVLGFPIAWRIFDRTEPAFAESI
jgi:lipopolysaccharide transport system permease protein